MSNASRFSFVNTQLVPFEQHQEWFEELVRSGQSQDVLFVIECNGRSVGMIGLYGFDQKRRQAEWGRFVVEPRMRGRGIGRAALALLFVEARRRGLMSLHCSVLGDNATAVRLYGDLGMRVTGERVDKERRFLEMQIDLKEFA